MTDLDTTYMARALQLAALGAGYNMPNPFVGAVLVHQGRIIGEGYHQQYGQAHAEVNAVASVQEADKHLIAQATLYVSLEPCCHYGKTPPCVELILRERIPRVVVACTDPFPLVAGKGVERLRQAGIDVTVGVLEQEALWQNRRFFTNVQQQRPYIVLKWAQSLDGFIGKVGETTAISNRLSQRLVHQWRSQEMSILVGTTTALVDNPQLTNRLYTGKTPIRLVLDKDLRLPPTLHLFDQTVPTIVFTSQASAIAQSKPNLQFVPLPFGESLLPALLRYLHKQKIQSVLVEGGAQLLRSFIQQNLWDEARVLIGNQRLGDGVAAPSLTAISPNEQSQLEDNQLFTYFNH